MLGVPLLLPGGLAYAYLAVRPAPIVCRRCQADQVSKEELPCHRGKAVLIIMTMGNLAFHRALTQI